MLRMFITAILALFIAVPSVAHAQSNQTCTIETDKPNACREFGPAGSEAFTLLLFTVKEYETEDRAADVLETSREFIEQHTATEEEKKEGLIGWELVEIDDMLDVDDYTLSIRPFGAREIKYHTILTVQEGDIVASVLVLAPEPVDTERMLELYQPMHDALTDDDYDDMIDILPQADDLTIDAEFKSEDSHPAD